MAAAGVMTMPSPAMGRHRSCRCDPSHAVLVLVIGRSIERTLAIIRPNAVAASSLEQSSPTSRRPASRGNPRISPGSPRPGRRPRGSPFTGEAVLRRNLARHVVGTSSGGGARVRWRIHQWRDLMGATNPAKAPGGVAAPSLPVVHRAQCYPRLGRPRNRSIPNRLLLAMN